MNAISALIRVKRKLVPFSLSSAMGGHKEKIAIYKTRSRLLTDIGSASLFISDISASRTLQNKCLLSKLLSV